MKLGWFKRSERAKHAAIDVAGLLGRKPVNLDTPELQRFLAGKRVLVTGAGGSIGSEICRQTMRFCPDRLILLDRAENALFEIDRELRERWVGAQLIPAVADVCDSKRIGLLFDQYKPHVIFHAAAHKHVPMMEHNPGEAVKNNVFGTKVVADAAAAFKAQAFVLISTDKAVRPTSVMGATKRLAEIYVQSLNATEDGGLRIEDRSSTAFQSAILNPQCSTRFLAVRFGNVLGSSGSVVPIFDKQIEAGGPVTVTHPDMKRYFMTIPEASQLVMQAGAIGKGGEIFVLDMGEPVKILDLALQMIRRHGLQAGRDIEIHYTGVRPGEKLYEELAGDDERTCATSHRKIRVWSLPVAAPNQVRRSMELLRDVVDGSGQRVRFALGQCVPEYSGKGDAERGARLRLVTEVAEPVEKAA
ncbi:hypothetical protein BH09PLA1_BH09PLA1_23300 [soil metagenome]